MKAPKSWKDYLLSYSYSPDGAIYSSLPFSEYYPNTQSAKEAIEELYDAALKTCGDKSWQNQIVQPLEAGHSFGSPVMRFEIYVQEPGYMKGFYLVEAHIGI